MCSSRYNSSTRIECKTTKLMRSRNESVKLTYSFCKHSLGLCGCHLRRSEYHSRLCSLGQRYARRVEHLWRMLQVSSPKRLAFVTSYFFMLFNNSCFTYRLAWAQYDFDYQRLTVEVPMHEHELMFMVRAGAGGSAKARFRGHGKHYIDDPDWYCSDWKGELSILYEQTNPIFNSHIIINISFQQVTTMDLSPILES